jgi:hypothetical protein
VVERRGFGFQHPGILASRLYRNQTQLTAAPTITVFWNADCYGHSLGQLKLLRNAAPPYRGGMVLRLQNKDFLRLRGARGVAIQVVGGRVWITEDGHPGDRFLAAGGRYRVGGDGLVLIEAEANETDLRLVA